MMLTEAANSLVIDEAAASNTTAASSLLLSLQSGEAGGVQLLATAGKGKKASSTKAAAAAAGGVSEDDLKFDFLTIDQAEDINLFAAVTLPLLIVPGLQRRCPTCSISLGRSVFNEPVQVCTVCPQPLFALN